jgi:hypothetical protein
MIVRSNEPSDIKMNSRPLFPNFWFAVLLCGIFLGLALAAMVPVGIADAVFKIKLVSNPLATGVVNLIAAAGALAIGKRIGRESWREILPLKPVSPLLVLVAGITLLGAFIVLAEVDNLLRLVLPPPRWFSSLFSSLMNFKEYPFGSFFTLVLVAPLTEECLFRGQIMRGFLSRFSVCKAIVVSSILFGLLHLNPWQFASAAFGGLLLGWWRVRTGSLWLCFLGHALQNGTALFAPHLPFRIAGFNTGDPFGPWQGFQPWWLDLGGLVLLVGGVWVFHRLAPKPSPETLSPEAPIHSLGEALPPVPLMPPQSSRRSLAIASLVLGILAMLLSLFLIGAVLGAIGLVLGLIHIRGRLGRNAMAWWGVGLSIAGVAAAIACGCYYYQTYQKMDDLLGISRRAKAIEQRDAWEGVPAPDFEVRTLDGETVRLSDLRGKRVVLDFWATWCPPCVKEIPHFVQLHGETSRDDLVILGFSSEEASALDPFLEKAKVGYPIVSTKGQKLPAPFSKTQIIPTTFFIDRNGVIQSIAVGYDDFAAIKERALAADFAGELKAAPATPAAPTPDGGTRDDNGD